VFFSAGVHLETEKIRTESEEWVEAEEAVFIIASAICEMS
jgi:hypothetical protein